MLTTTRTPLWLSVEAMAEDSKEFQALTGSLPTFDQLIVFAELKQSR
jgi:hypothetical protein